MPSFPQYILGSLYCLLTFAGFYHFVLKGVPSFHLKRWYLRMMPVIGFSLPLFPALSGKPIPFRSAEVSRMAIESWWHIDFPAFDVSLKTILLAIFFVGFTVNAFRAVDRFWSIGRFLNKQKVRLTGNTTRNSGSTERVSQLVILWEHWRIDQKETWATQNLPVSIFLFWEVLLLEIIGALNWWNPVMPWYRHSWKKLFLDDFETCAAAKLPAWKLIGIPCIFTAAFLLFVIPEKYSPTCLAGTWIGQKQEMVLFKYEKQLPQPYTFQWGQLTIPLIKYANPNGYVGEFALELSEFKQILLDEIKLYRGKERLKPGTLSLLYRSSRTNEQAYINDIDPASILLMDRRSGKVYNDAVGYGDEIVLFGETEDIYLSRIQISIIDPQAGYEPAVDVPDIDHQSADFSFQLVERTGERTLVKLDSENANAAYILQLYQDSNRYEIVKIPGFRTNRRYLTHNEALLSKFSAASFDMASNLPDVNYLPEYQNYQELKVSLAWGNLTAAPSVNTTPEKFLMSNSNTPVLMVGESSFKLEAFEIIIAGNKTLPLGYHADHLDYPSLRNTLSYVQPETSVYFDRIVIRDMDGALKLFPAAFAFHVGKTAEIPEVEGSNQAGN